MNSKECTCVPCDECNGTGWVWRSFSGEYLGNSRCDDLDTLDVCPVCDGERIVEMCDHCKDLHREAFEYETKVA